MASISTLVDRVKIIVQSSGTGAFELGPAVAAFRGVEALIDGATYSYATENGARFEAGTGVYNSSLGVLVRTPIISSNGGAAVAFPANVEVAFTALAQDLVATGGTLPIVDSVGDGVDVAISQRAATASVESKVTATDLASPAGAGKVGFSQTETYDAGTEGYRLIGTVCVTDSPFNAPTDGTTSADAAFTAAAATGALVHIPRGSFKINADVGSTNTVWLLDAGAVIVGLPDIGIPTVCVINDTSRLRGRMVRYGASPLLGPAVRVGDTRGWMEKDIRGTTESYCTLPVISPAGGIAITGASRTSDSPDKLNTAMSCIGGNFYAINDTPVSDGQTAYAGYKEAQRKANCGLAWVEEIDSVNFGPDTIDIKPSTPLTYAAYTGGYVINAGGGHPDVFPSSVGLTFQYNGATFRRGIVFNAGSVDPATNEVLAVAQQHRHAWYDSNNVLVSFMDGAVLTRTVDAAGSLNVTDSVIRKGGGGAASPSLGTIYLSQQYGWTGSALYQGTYVRTLQRTGFSGGNARFSYDINAKNSNGTDCQVSLNGVGDNQFGPVADNAVSFGAASARVSVYYGATGAINTSDERMKTWRGGLSDADKRAARRIIDEIGWYQWNDAIEEKGEDSARRHIGVRAQRVARILMDEGLEDTCDLDFPLGVFIPENQRPNFRTAFLTFDTWPEVWQDEFEEIDDVEIIDVVRISRTDTGLKDGKGNPIIRTERIPETIEQPVKRSQPTGNRTKIKEAGNILGIRDQQLHFYLISVLGGT